MAHVQKPDFFFRRNGRVHLNRQRASVQSTTGSWGVRISGSNAGYTMFRGTVKGTGYLLHSPVTPSLFSPVRYRAPSHFNWNLPYAAYRVNCLLMMNSYSIRNRYRIDYWNKLRERQRERKVNLVVSYYANKSLCKAHRISKLPNITFRQNTTGERGW
jgi:hypothetical protein